MRAAREEKWIEWWPAVVIKSFVLLLIFWGAPAGLAQERSDAVPSPAVRASTLLGHGVEDRYGKRFAEIDDLIVNADGLIDRVVLSLEGILGIETRLVAVVFSALVIDREWRYRTRIAADGTKERIPWELKWRIRYTGDPQRLRQEPEYHYDYQHPRGGTAGWGIYSHEPHRPR